MPKAVQKTPEEMQSIRWGGMRRLREMRDNGLTYRQLGQEIFDHARRTGTDIQQVRGRRRPTEVFRDGQWIKVVDLS